MGLVFSNLLPQIGVNLYEYNDNNFASCCLFWCSVNLVSAVLFYIGFTVINTKSAITENNTLTKLKITDQKNQNKKHHGLYCLIKTVINQNATRNLFLVYTISKSLHKTATAYKTIIYLKEKDLGGVGFTKDELKIWQTMSIFPALLILFGYKQIVP